MQKIQYFCCFSIFVPPLSIKCALQYSLSRRMFAEKKHDFLVAPTWSLSSSSSLNQSQYFEWISTPRCKPANRISCNWKGVTCHKKILEVFWVKYQAHPILTHVCLFVFLNLHKRWAMDFSISFATVFFSAKDNFRKTWKKLISHIWAFLLLNYGPS